MLEATNSSQESFESAGNAISGGYTGNSFAVRALIVFFTGLSMYNACELIILVYLTFTRYRGLYFWSLIIASAGIVPYSLGFLFKFFEITIGTTRWLSMVLLTIGWWTMVTGQSIVLWSRLHLILSGDRGTKVLKATKWMIIVDAIILHIPTTVLTFGCNGSVNVPTFVHVFSIYEKVQMVGFFIQEVILSSIYIIETVQILKTSLQPNTRKLMNQLFAINILIISMDVALLGLEFANLYIWETETKSLIYSIKLKLEFAVLSKLVNFVGGAQNDSRRQNSIAFATEKEEDGPSRNVSEVPDFVDISRLSVDVTHASDPATRRKPQRTSANEDELDVARFEHLEAVTTFEEAQRVNSNP